MKTPHKLGDTVINAFLKRQKTLGKSDNTIDAYQRDLVTFVRFFLVFSDALSDKQKEAVDNKVHKIAELLSLFTSAHTWKEITFEQIQNFVGYRMQSGLSAKTIARQLSAIRLFFQFLIEQDLIPHNPAKLIKAPKQSSPLPKSLDVDLTTQLLTAPPSAPVHWLAIRDQAIFEVLYSAALRVSECATLDLSPHLDPLSTGWVQVTGKGNKVRLAPIGKTALYHLQAWLAIRDAHAKPQEKAVFVNRSGTRLGVRSIQLRLDKRTRETSLPTKMSPHRLRHACATHVLESSGDLRAVQELLGHANLSTTQIYTKLDLQHLASVYDKTHPRAKKKPKHNAT